MEGTPFGRYRLLSLLGRGGMGEVWRAFDTETNRIVAVKLLPANLAHDPQFEQRFRREANAAAGLNDPHVVPIHNFGEIDGRLYVDMRLIEGRDLHKLIADGPMHPARAVNIIEHVASALDSAHRIGLAHRDVKPSNILIGERDFAYLIDFGIARAANETAMTSTGAVIGTWAYLAPERITGEPDHRADIYALACVLHECLTGQQPFPGNSMEKQIGGHLALPPPHPSALNDTVPTRFDEVIGKGMAKNPDDRYTSASSLANAARSAITAPTALPPRIPVTGWLSETAAPTWNAPPPGHSRTPAMDPLIEPTQFRPRPETQPPSTSARSKARWWGIAAAVGVVALVAALAVVIVNRDDRTAPATLNSSITATGPLPSGPTFDGTFTAAYGPQATFSGAAMDGFVAAAKWVVRSVCNQSGCVAAATTVNRPEGVLTRIFDYVDGQWISVSAEPANGECAGVDIQRWERMTLRPQPDGSMVGDVNAANSKYFCGGNSPVTFTRTGDSDAGVQTSDLATMTARVVSPVNGVHGRYHLAMRYTRPTAPESYDFDLVGTTFCLRGGDRCLNYLYGPIGVYALKFAAGQWTWSSSTKGTCATDGTPEQNDIAVVFPLPQPNQDPIQLIVGHGNVTFSGGCAGSVPADLTFTRIGD
jgi:serine/threonine protein kinase